MPLYFASVYPPLDLAGNALRAYVRGYSNNNNNDNNNNNNYDNNMF